MAKRQPNNIRKFNRHRNFNISILIFGIIFVYIVVAVFMYFTSERIVGYEVHMGSLSTSNIYQGIAIRTEEIVNSTDSGYVNYYAREGEKIGFGNLVYTVDESGKLADSIVSGDASQNSLSDEDLTELKTQIVSFRNEFNRENFSTVYDFKYSVQGTAMKLANYNILDSIDSLSSEGLVQFGYATGAGVIVYSTDNMEKLKPEDVTPEMFEPENYEKKQLISNELIASGDPVYKLCTEEEWSIVIPVEEERAQELEDAGYVNVKFLKNQLTSWASVKVLRNGENAYACLTFTNSMITFCTDRFIDLELILNDDKGLKIPNSSIIEREFFLVPETYMVQGDDSDTYGVLKETYGEDGTATTEFIETPVYNIKDGEYYLDDNILRIGDNIIKPDSTEKYTISKRGSLIGVYNMNKGYADFKQISILYQNEEYAIVKSNTDYGLSVYDYIVLDAATVNEDDFIYE